jgi:hypothetical protein
MSNPVDRKKREEKWRKQIEKLKEEFMKLNPDADPQEVDWEHETDMSNTEGENRLDLATAYPTFKWFASEEEMRSVKREALNELEDQLSYMLTAVPEEAKEDFKEIFDAYISRVRYAIDRKLKIAPLRKEVAELREKLEEAKGKREAPKLPPEIKKVQWTPRLEQRLKDTFEATLRREGLTPTRYWSEYRLELEQIKALNTEEDMVKAVKDLAEEKIREVRPPTPERPIPPRLLPPTPETCPIDRTPLEPIQKIMVRAPLRLPEEEEHPTPTVEGVWIDIPSTMKVLTCRENHYFERDEAGRLIERTEEYLYRKILRETEKLRGLLAPPAPPTIPAPPAPITPRKPIFPKFDEWLKMEKKLEMWEYIKKSEDEKKGLLAEYDKYIKDMLELT